jgi:hypothetical protein
VSGLRPVINLIRLAWWKWAASEISPLHPDAPRVHRTVYLLERET